MADPRIARVAGLFDALSDSYDTVGVPFFQPIAAGLVQALAPQPGQRWLDIGCGRGAVLLPAAEAIGPAGRAVGLDISTGMVEQARAAASSRGLHNVRVELDDAQDPRVDDPPFDVISSSLVLFFLPDPSAAVRSWRPLLTDGGRLGVTTFGPADERWQSVDDVFDPFLPPDMKDARTSGSVGPFASDEGMERLLSDAGFSDVRTVVDEIPVHFRDAEQWHAFTWSVGQRAMWLSVPEGQRAEVRRDAERRLLAYADADGSVTFTQRVRHTLARA